MGLLLITHDLAVVSGMAQQVALMYAGQIVEVASAAEFFAAPAPYARRAARAARYGQARRRAGRHRRHRAGAVAGVQWLPLCAALRARHGGLPHTLPAMERCGASSGALPAYRDGAVPAALADSAEPLRYAAPRAEAPAQALLEVRDPSVRFPIRKGCCSASQAPSPPWAASPSTSRPAARWPWWARAAAARPPPARPSCNCCASRR